MKTKFRKEKSNPSIISKIDPHIENLGVLTPVHIEDIVKDKNLDYLESLGQLVQRTQANPIWFQYQSNENKMKFLQVYQLSINYARNTEDIYNNVSNQLDQQFLIRKNKVDKLKSDILAHKDKTNKLKKHFQKQKLLKEKQKVLKYEKNIRNIRDNLIKQKKQIQAKNQRLMQQQRLEQQQLLKQAQKNKNHPNPYQYKPDHYYPQPPPPYGYPYGAYPYAPPPPPYYHPQQSNPNTQQNLQQIKPQNILQMFNLSLNPKHKNIKQQTKNQQGQQESFEIMPQQEQAKKSKKLQERQNKILNKLSKKDQIKQSIKLSKKQSIKQSKKSDTNSGQQKNSNKAWTLGNSTNNINNIRDSYAESQTQDVVKDLEIHAPISSVQKKLSDSSKMSQMSKRKQSDLSDQDVNSMINIQLKTQSQNDVNDQFQKKNKIKRVESISEDVQQKQKPKKPVHRVDTISDEQRQQQKQDKNKFKKYDNKMSIKVTKQKQSPPSSMIDSVADSRKNYSYLQQSNQGDRTKGIQFLGLNKLKVKDIDKIGNSHGHSLMNSLEDVESKHQSQSRVQIADDYSQSGFDDYQDLMNTKKKIGPSISSPDKQKQFQYLPLLKNTFILKQDAISFNESKYSSGIGSLKDFSVKFVGSQKKRTFQDKSQQGLSDYGDDMMDLIEMPMDSCIAKPSKLKQSTIKKSTIQQKIHKSYDPKSNDSKPGQFVPETPLKHVRFSSKDNLDDNFADIKDFDKLQSKNIAKNNNNNNNLLKPPPANKPQEKLLMSVTQSHVIQQDLVETKSDKLSDQQKQLAQSQSINLSVIQQNENQSVNTDNSVKQNILLLIHKKYKQKGAQQYNNGIITQQINKVMKDRKDLSLQEIEIKFNQLSKNLQLQIAALSEKRKKKKGSKDGQSAKQKSKQSSRQNSLKIIKSQKSNPIPKPKKTEQDELDDDLTYSRSILENPNDVKLKSTQSKIYKKSQIIKKPDNKTANQGQVVNPNSKYLREQTYNKNKNSSTNMAISLAEVDKYNKDDQLTNALKNFAVNQLETIKQKDIDDDQNF